ncbi:hypothetical protein H9649_07115 [Sporosarcina sp. Sa2YVA2]|uniref:Lipoprotein n=1 Tax=Sporosarcina quadrami TaxID=2762234 RepID=A0ABR8U9F5_9BACL|nr:hypothetical protein [Sporosarcina quadrami]MBD7984343.1 hypothetical protein [Sporosarcina quadrami]
MFRSWKFLFLLILSISVLTACGQTLDERAADGIAVAKEAFLLDDKQTNDEVQGVSLYKPSGFTIAEDSDAQNIVMKKGDETFILFINTNEEKDSRLFYDLLDNNEERKRFEEVFTSDGYFGFASVVKIGEDQVELITSVGGVKMTTITKKKNIRNDLARMMEITRSINQ